MKLWPGSLLTKILVVTLTALSALYLVTGWITQERVLGVTSRNLEHEAQASLQAYESLWKARADLLGAVSLALSGMSDVRAAFGTRDAATISDLAGERWAALARERALFVVADPSGRVIASLGGFALDAGPLGLPVVRSATRQFPGQSSGFLVQDHRLYQVVVTPVYVEGGQGPALLNVLVAGYAVDSAVAARLRAATGGSEFVFLTEGQPIASTLEAEPTRHLMTQLGQARESVSRVSDGQSEYALLRRPLMGIDGHPVGELCILRSFDQARQEVGAMRRDLAVVWVVAILCGLVLTFVLVRHLLRPIAQLDQAAGEISRENYDHRVPVESDDELGRLGATFNTMCASIQRGRAELVRQERLSTIGRLSSSLVHDLRNPLAAIYAGAEMLVDTELSEAHIKRLAANIYRASGQIQSMLGELSHVSRGRSSDVEWCALSDLVLSAADRVAVSAQSHRVELKVDVPPDLELQLERARVERVFTNLFMNAIEAMQGGGVVRVTVTCREREATVCVEDDGPGIHPSLRGRLFEPFATAGKRNGLGLGLALARQTIRDHGGDLWVADRAGRGACFCVLLPVPVRTTAAS